MSKKHTININNRLEFLRRQLKRIDSEAVDLEKQLDEYQGVCWSCEHTGETTGLVACEIGNANYPNVCGKYA